MRIEVYIPDYELDVIVKVLELKETRKLSSYIVDLIKNEPTRLTEERIIEIIQKYKKV